MCFLLIPLYSNCFIISFLKGIFNYGICDMSRKGDSQKVKGQMQLNVDYEENGWYCYIRWQMPPYCV